MNETSNETSNETIAPALLKLFTQFVGLQNLKDLPGLSACIHDESPGATAMKKSIAAMFDHYTLNVSPLMQVYIGKNGGYAYYHFKQKIEKISGPDFTDSIVEILVVFRQQQNQWKIWNCFPLMLEAA